MLMCNVVLMCNVTSACVAVKQLQPQMCHSAKVCTDQSTSQMLHDGGAFARAQMSSLGAQPMLVDSSGFANAVPVNAGPPMGSIGSQKDLQELYRRYSSLPVPQQPARMLSMHDSAGSTGLEEVARCEAHLSILWHPCMGGCVALADSHNLHGMAVARQLCNKKCVIALHVHVQTYWVQDMLEWLHHQSGMP